MNERRSAYKPFFRPLSFLVPVLLLFGILCALFVSSLRTNEREKSRCEQSLVGEAGEQANLLAARLEGQYELLETYSAYLAILGQSEMAESIWRMGALATHNSFSRLLFALPDGGVINSGINLVDCGYFQQALAGSRAAQALRDGVLSSRPYIVLAVPLYRDGAVFGVVLGCYDGEWLEELFAPGYAGSSDDMLVVDSHGGVIAQKGDVNLRTGSLEELARRATFARGYDANTMLAALSGSAQETFEFTVDKEPYFAVMRPIGQAAATINDWKLICSVHDSVISNRVAAATRDNIELVLVLTVFFGAGFIFFIIREYRAYRAVIRDAERIRHENERFSIIYDYTTISVWDFYFDTHEIHQKSRAGGAPDIIIDNVPEGLVETGTVHPESAEAYLDMYKKLYAGAERAEGVFRILCRGDKGYRYEHIRYKTLFARNGRPYAAIGMAEDVTRRLEQEMAYVRWRQSFENMPAEKYRMAEYNLTADACEGNAGTLFSFLDDGESAAAFNGRIGAIAGLCADPEDAAKLQRVFLRESLIAEYEAGRNRHELEVHIDEGAGKGSKWIRIDVQVLPYPNSQDLKAYLLCQDINDEKCESLEMIRRSENDPLTGLLNRGTLVKRVGEMLDAGRPTEKHAFIMIDIDGFKLVNDAFGHMEGDRLLIELAGSMRALLRRDDIVGRIGGDEFAICMRNVMYDTLAAKKAQHLCTQMHQRVGLGLAYGASLSMGIAMYPRDGTTFDELYRNADAALYFTKRHGRNGYTFYREQMHRAYSADTAAAEPPAAKAINPAIQTVAIPRRYLLVVDGSEERRNRCKELFSQDYTIVLADSGRAGIEQMRRLASGIAVVLLDMDMPEMSGFEVLEYLHEQKEFARIPVIAVSAQENQAVELRAIRAGALDFICKNADLELLRLRVQSVLLRMETEFLYAQNLYLHMQSEEEARFEQVLCATDTVVFTLDLVNGTYLYDQRAGRLLAGNYDRRPLLRIFAEDRVADPETVKLIADLIGRAKTNRERGELSARVELKTAAGETHWFKLQAIPLSLADSPVPKLMLTISDVNQGVLAERELQFRAERDPLTGLYNRTAFIEKAGRLIAAAPPMSYMLLCADVENFKVINDQYGRPEGDRLLRGIADEIRRGTQAAGGVCCRLFADTFVALYPYAAQGRSAVAERLNAWIEPRSLPFKAVLDIGVYVVSDTALPVGGMIDRAILAQRSIRKDATQFVAYYHESMRENLLREQTIANHMEASLKEERFLIYLQPQYNHVTGELAGAEALVRWAHPTLGLFEPNGFIPLFERNGFITKLDAYIFEHACQLLQKWRNMGKSVPPVSVNISRHSLLQSTFARDVQALAKRYQIRPEKLWLEITESAFVDVSEQLYDMIKQLRASRFLIEIDDFGSGYSSLNTLKDVPADIIKLDMRFFEQTQNDRRSNIIIESIVHMARRLELRTIAEGVETLEQANYLRSIGCNVIQGYLYAKPMPVEAFEELI